MSPQETKAKFARGLPPDIVVCGPTASFKALYRWLEGFQGDYPKKAQTAIDLIRANLETLREGRQSFCYPCEAGLHKSCECKCTCKERVIVQKCIPCNGRENGGGVK